MCLRAVKSVTASAYLSSARSAITVGMWLRLVRRCWYCANFVCFKQLSSLQNLSRKGRQIWSPPRAAKGPATSARHCLFYDLVIHDSCSLYETGQQRTCNADIQQSCASLVNICQSYLPTKKGYTCFCYLFVTESLHSINFSFQFSFQV